MSSQAKTNSDSDRIKMVSGATSTAKARGFKQTEIWKRARTSFLGHWTRTWRNCRHELFAWAVCKETIAPTVEQLTKSIEVLDARVSNPSNARLETEAPIFLLSTGWRAGSTLLQRILVTDPSLLLWGEPLG